MNRARAIRLFDTHVLGEPDARPAPTLGMRRNNAAFTFLAGATFPWVGSWLAVMVGAAGTWAVARLAARHFGWVRDRATLYTALAFALFFASAVLTNVIHFDGGANIAMIVNRLPYLALLPVASRYALSPADATRRTLENGAVIGAAIAAVFALYQVASGYGRADALNANPMPFAATNAMILVILINGAMAGTGTRRIVMAAAAILPILSIAASGARTYWLVLPVIALLALFRGGIPGIRRIGLAVLAAGVLAAAAWLFAGDMLEARLIRLLDDVAAHGLEPDATTSLGQRIAMWTCGVDAFMSSPLFGLGRAAGREFLSACTAGLVGADLGFSHFHNALLSAGVFGGAVDIVATLAMATAPLVASVLAPRGAQRASGAMLLRAVALAWLVAGLFSTPHGNDVLDATFVFMTLIGLHLCAAPARGGEPA